MPSLNIKVLFLLSCFAATFAAGSARAASESVLYSFKGGTDGAVSFGGSLLNLNGTLYGVTLWGGVSACDTNNNPPGCGTVFSLATSGPSAGTETIVHAFTQGAGHARWPSATLIDVRGKLYGTTNDPAAVFSVGIGGGERTFAAIEPGGYYGSGDGVIDVGGKLYGATAYGGSYSHSCPLGCGTIYSMTPGGVVTVLYSFQGGSDGEYPEGGLVEVGGVLYGTTSGGGTGSCNWGAGNVETGCGTVFSVTLTGAENVIYSFQGDSDGWGPTGSLIRSGNALYGTTAAGGSAGVGTVFRVSTAGIEKVVYAFRGGSDGEEPFLAPLVEVGGIFYGTTSLGGNSCANGGVVFSNSCGTVFSVTRGGTEHVVYAFAGGSDGANPEAGLTYVNGVFYGTTYGGGTGTCSNQGYNGCGTVFQIVP